MSRIVPDALLSQLSEFIAARMGLHFPRARWHDLERAIVSAAGDFAHQDPESCIRWLLASPLTRRQIEILSTHLTVGETYFFREKASFDSLGKSILPQLIRARGNERSLRIWSAGCSTGEEPYSVAILLTELLRDRKDWNITILATDINALALHRASQGVYKEWSFRDVAPGLREKYFDRTKDGHFELAQQVKELVTFAHVNLADDAYPALETNTNAMDIIFCRNVLMYFEPDCARKVVHKFHHALIEGGWLIVSPAEASHTLFSPFITCNFPGAILYKKDSSRARETLSTGPIPGLPLEEPGMQRHPLPGLDAEPLVAGFVQGAGRMPQVETPERKAETPEPTPYQEASDLYKQGRYAEAVEKIKVGLSRDPHDARTMVLLARAYANQGRLAEALEWCRAAVGADQLNPGWRYLLATVLQEQGRDEEALMALKHALYLDSGYALAHFALGNLTRRQGKVRDSDRHYRNALSVLSRCRPQELLPDAAGITAGRLAEIIRSTILGEAVNER